MRKYLVIMSAGCGWWLANGAQAACPVFPTCEEMGYTMTSIQCGDQAVLKCPSDRSKLFCADPSDEIACTVGAYYNPNTGKCSTSSTYYIYLANGYITKRSEGGFYAGDHRESEISASFINEKCKNTCTGCIPVTREDLETMAATLKKGSVYGADGSCFVTSDEIDGYAYYRLNDEEIPGTGEYGELLADWGECYGYSSTVGLIVIGCKYKP